MTDPALLFEIDQLARSGGDQTAFCWLDRPDLDTWSFADLAGLTGAAVQRLVAGGAEPGQTLAVVGGNGPQWVVLREAARWLGLTFVPVGPRLAVPERDWLLTNAQAQWRIGDPRLPGGNVSITSWDHYFDGGTADLPGRPDDRPARRLLYTSGSGGRPKGVLRAQESDRNRIHQSIGAYRLDPSMHHLIAGPLYHSGPAIFYLIFRSMGAPQSVLCDFDAATVARQLASGGFDAVFMVPTMWRMVLDQLDALGASPAVKVAWIAGSHTDPVTRQRMLAALGDGVLWEFYGATETGTVSILDPARQSSHGHTVGFPAPGVNINVVDENGNGVERGVPGKVYVQSPAAMIDYHQGPGSAPDLAADRRGEWLSVGDRGYLTDDGALVLLGREGGMVITGGINVYPEEVEAALRRLDAVREAVVFGEPDPKWGQRLVAAVEPADPGTAVVPEQLGIALRGELAGYKIPKRWIIGPIPRTQSGKVVRSAAAYQDAANGKTESGG